VGRVKSVRVLRGDYEKSKSESFSMRVRVRARIQVSISLGQATPFNLLHRRATVCVTLSLTYFNFRMDLVSVRDLRLRRCCDESRALAY
jgi:hypothetical protein